METNKSGTWLIFGIGGVPDYAFEPSQEYDSRAAARIAAYDVVERHYRRQSEKVEGTMLHRVVVGQCDSEGNETRRDGGLMLTVIVDADGGVDITEKFDKGED